MQYTNLRCYPIQTDALEVALPVFLQKVCDFLTGSALEEAIAKQSQSQSVTSIEQIKGYADSLSAWAQVPVFDLHHHETFNRDACVLLKQLKLIIANLDWSKEFLELINSSEFNLYDIAIHIRGKEYEEFYSPTLRSITVLQALAWVVEDHLAFRNPFLVRKIIEDGVDARMYGVNLKQANDPIQQKLLAMYRLPASVPQKYAKLVKSYSRISGSPTVSLAPGWCFEGKRYGDHHRKFKSNKDLLIAIKTEVVPCYCDICKEHAMGMGMK